MLIGQRYSGLYCFQPRPPHGPGENSVNTRDRLLLSGATSRAAGRNGLSLWANPG
ncbi:potassium-transporting ATPase subunit C [Streptomyces akebiae]|uniref:hypothetical protein n=1 Tax=Streptomyces akebiae TaxID=2865673 RepID=UPI00294FEF83|nr:hypothetical protein [Streptomyces akebiae]